MVLYGFKAISQKNENVEIWVSTFFASNESYFHLDCKPFRPQSRYNKGYLSPISDMEFQFLAIWAVQGSTENKIAYFFLYFCFVH